jgi:hypothetical protein
MAALMRRVDELKCVTVPDGWASVELSELEHRLRGLEVLLCAVALHYPLPAGDAL